MPKGVYKRTEYHREINRIAHQGQSTPSRKGVVMSDDQKEKISRSHRGKNTWSRGRKISKKHRMALIKANTGRKLSLEHKNKISNAQKGSKSHNWKGGISSENKRIRMSIEYRLWRESVFARDNWKCQNCKKRGGTLHPHHIKSFADYPELRFAIDNGVTLCVACHKEEHERIRNVKSR